MSEITSIIVFGPTGTTGLQILKRGISEGLEVTAFVRDPSKIPDDINEKLHRIIQGDVLDKRRVEEAIEGHDAVLSALGKGWGFRNKDLLTRGCRNIVAGMKKYNVKQLVVVSNSAFLSGERSRCNRFLNRFRSLSDHQKQIQILEENSGSIDWIMMMPPSIKNSTNINPDYKVQRNNLPGGYSVTAGELADFMVKVFMDKTSRECFTHCKLGISSYPSSWRKIWIALGMGLLAVAFGAVFHYRMLPEFLQEFVDTVLDNEPKYAIKD